MLQILHMIRLRLIFFVWMKTETVFIPRRRCGTNPVENKCGKFSIPKVYESCLISCDILVSCKIWKMVCDRCNANTFIRTLEICTLYPWKHLFAGLSQGSGGHIVLKRNYSSTHWCIPLNISECAVLWSFRTMCYHLQIL